MACFLVPATEAIVTTIAEKAVKAKEDRREQNGDIADTDKASAGKIRLSAKLGWLNKMLWGGSALLAFEHLWHGELSLFYPFLTAMENAEDTTAMLHEMSTVGVSMAALVTVVWGIMVAVVSRMRRKNSECAIEEIAANGELVREEVRRDS